MKVVEDTLSKDGIKRMLPRDFRALGYLQELNRIFLHPLGLALEIIVDTATNEEYLVVYGFIEILIMESYLVLRQIRRRHLGLQQKK